jgi:Fe-S cluster assembly ATP-binding protein
MESDMLEINNLSCRVKGEKGAKQILSDVSLVIPDRKFVVITGPNGSGKTTLARAVMGLVPASSGTISYNGTDITKMSITERAKIGLGFGFQQPPRFKGLRVIDLLEIAAERKLSNDECCQYLNQVGLCSKDYVNREIDASLSGGEVKRIEIASVLARNSEFMIFDEPEAGIDLWSFSRLTETFGEIRARGTSTLLVISHQERIIRLADEIVIIAGGKVTMHGPQSEMIHHLNGDTIVGCSCMEAGIK